MRHLYLAAALLSAVCLAGCSAQKETPDAAANTAPVENAVPAENTVAAPEENTTEAAPAENAAPAYTVDEKYRPAIYATLPDDMYGPDALCWDEANQSFYLSVPNFIEGEMDVPITSSFLARIHADGTVEKAYEFPILEGETKIGCMGLEFGPDGNLYVCDNQYFFDANFKSRLWRVRIQDGQPTGAPELVVKGLKVANAILWDGDSVYVTDTILDEAGKYGSGGIWRFTSEELLAAGTDEAHPAIDVTRTGDERPERLIIVEDAVDVRGNNCGADGICKDTNGVFYFGNYGDGAFYRFRFGEDGKPEVEKVKAGGDLFRCVDGICFDPVTNKIYITDSADNSVWAVAAKPWGEPLEFERIWENEDTDGADGSLDLPCECRVVNGKLVISNQDLCVGTTGKCQKTDKPYSLSVISLQ